MNGIYILIAIVVAIVIVIDLACWAIAKVGGCS